MLIVITSATEASVRCTQPKDPSSYHQHLCLYKHPAYYLRELAAFYLFILEVFWCSKECSIKQQFRQSHARLRLWKKERRFYHDIWTRYSMFSSGIHSSYEPSHRVSDSRNLFPAHVTVSRLPSSWCQQTSLLYSPLEHQAPFTLKPIFLQNSGLLWTDFIAKLNIEETDLHFPLIFQVSWC